MQFSSKAVDIIKQFEGFRSKPYLDAVAIPTIGYGTTEYVDGRKVTMNDKAVTETEAAAMLITHLTKIVAPVLSSVVTAPLSQNQVDSLGSLIYNIGDCAFRKSTVLKLINAKAPISEIEKAWMMWVKAGGKTLDALVKRRQKEFTLYKS